MRAPTAVNLSGYLRNSTISPSSCLASSTPATSMKVTDGLSPATRRARLRPKDIAWLFPDWLWRSIHQTKKTMIPTSTSVGRRLIRMVVKSLPLF
jgi:hypothetical protein